ncbi:MAG: hypothetical protein AAB019_11335 [Planctomycetota bacterium]
MTESSKQKFSWAGLLIALGIAGYFTICIGTLYYLTGDALGVQHSFKGIVVGTLIGLGVLLILGVFGEMPKKLFSSARIQACWDVAKHVFLLGVVALFGYLYFIPTLQHKSATFYTGEPEATYKVTYTDGKEEIKTGGQMGQEKWGYTVGLYFSICLVIGGLSLSFLARNLWRFKNANSSTPFSSKENEADSLNKQE